MAVYKDDISFAACNFQPNLHITHSTSGQYYLRFLAMVDISTSAEPFTVLDDFIQTFGKNKLHLPRPASQARGVFKYHAK